MKNLVNELSISEQDTVTSNLTEKFSNLVNTQISWTEIDARFGSTSDEFKAIVDYAINLSRPLFERLA